MSKRPYLDKHRIYHKQYHYDNKEVRNHNALTKRLRNKLRAIERLGGKCSDCNGVFDTCVYDFHHKDPSTKDGLLGSFFNWNWGEKIEREIDKCILLCANCHRLRHKHELGRT